MIEIEAPGPLATVQDLGRRGYADLGVGRSGAADRDAHRLANRLVGNAESAATVEITLGGTAFRLHQASTIALTGARCDVISQRPLEWNAAMTVAAGTTIGLGIPATGLRSYLAVRGGIGSPATLGSRSTDTLSGLGPPALLAGAVLPIGTDVASDPAGEAVTTAINLSGPMRVIAGPRQDWFTESAQRLLTGAIWIVDPASSRIGIRLNGPVLDRAVTKDLPPEPTLPGAIQVPPNGQPIVLGPDAPVTGGYPVIAVVVHADLGRLAQLRPGQPTSFQAGGRSINALAEYANGT